MSGVIVKGKKVSRESFGGQRKKRGKNTVRNGRQSFRRMRLTLCGGGGYEGTYLNNKWRKAMWGSVTKNKGMESGGKKQGHFATFDGSRTTLKGKIQKLK